MALNLLMHCQHKTDMNAKAENFSFSPINIERIKNLNSKLKKEETRIRLFANELNLKLKKQAQEKQIDDFNFEQSFCVFSNNADCNKRQYAEEGNPIWEDKTFLIFGEDPEEESFYNDNWNELHPPHPLAHLFFCYTMHCLIFHSQLSWQDIVDIDDVWIELKVDYQFFVEG